MLISPFAGVVEAAIQLSELLLHIFHFNVHVEAAMMHASDYEAENENRNSRTRQLEDNRAATRCDELHAFVTDA